MKWLVGVGVLALGAVFVYFLAGKDAPTIQAFPEELSDEPDAILKGFAVKHFNQQGVKLYELSAETASYDARIGQTGIGNLNMSVVTENQTHWHLKAGEGVYHDATVDSEIVLRGSVELRTKRASTDDDIVFLTETLYVFPDKQFAESESTITMTSRNSKIRADKVEIDMGPRNVRFISQSPSQVELLLRVND